MGNSSRIKLLLIEDEASDAEIICRLLAKSKSVAVDTVCVGTAGGAIALLENVSFDIVLSDLNLPDSSGMESFLNIRELFPEIPVIVLTGLNDEATAVSAVSRGAQDYLVKDQIDTNILVRSIRYAVERQKLLMQLERSLREIKTLQGLIPACAWCRKIRDDDGYWKRMEKYLEEHLDVSFTHGICPSCLRRTRPDLYQKVMTDNPELLGRHREGHDSD